MTPDETAVLLAGIAAYDTRYKQQGEEAAFTVRLWAHAMEPVEASWASAFVTWWYRNKTDKIMVGHIVAAWNGATTREDTRESQTQQRTAIGQVLPERPQWFDKMKTKVEMSANWAGARQHRGREWQRARADALHKVASVPSPASAGLGGVSAAEERERRCVHWKTCACPHESCRGGFVDSSEDAAFQGPNGDYYEGARPCTWCAEAVTMAVELAPKRKGRR